MLMGFVLRPCLVMQTLLPSFAIVLLRKRELVALIVFLQWCDCQTYVSLPRGTVVARVQNSKERKNVGLPYMILADV